MSKTIGILAHVDAGKTTFSEQVLYHTHAIRSRGRVDHQNTFLDNQSIEKERGITVFSEQAEFSIHDCKFHWIDTPGHADFSAEMERALQVMDIAVILVSGVEGVQGHTETVFQLVQQKGVPCIFFINKTDREGADPKRTLAEIRSLLTKDAVCFTSRFRNGAMELSLAEEIAERDDVLLELYMDEGYDENRWLMETRRLIQAGKLFPCYSGSALQDEGIAGFLEDMYLLTRQEEPPNPLEEFSGLVYKIRHDKQGRRVAFLKVTSGVLHAKDDVSFLSKGSEQPKLEKIDEIRIYSGDKFQTVQKAAAGDLCAVVGLSEVAPGDSIGARLFRQEYQLTPMMMAKVVFEPVLAAKNVLRAFRLLEDEDPMLSVEWNEALEEIQVHIMGVIQLEVLQQIMLERFGIEVSFGECEIVYRETISDPVIGYGHFEPLRHYAEVHLRLEPAKRGSGISFSSECPTDRLDGRFQRLIHTHVMEKSHKGVLTGSDITDIRVVLLTGRAHIKHTEGGDFREATYRAIRQGLMQAQSVLLEPYYAFRITVPADCVGRVLSDIPKMRGGMETPHFDGDAAWICGRGPVSQFMNYGRELVAFSGGKGSISCRFDGYEPCANPEAVILKKGYDPDRDVLNSADSVFCAKGAGYPVKWFEVGHYIHCKE